MNQFMAKGLKLYFLYCSNSIDENDLRGRIHPSTGDELKFISLPCSGKIDLLYLVKAFETGADGLVLITCPEHQCHFLEGNLRASKRAQKVNSLLLESGMDRERIEVLSLGKGGIDALMASISDFRNRLTEIAYSAAS